MHLQNSGAACAENEFLVGEDYKKTIEFFEMHTCFGPVAEMSLRHK